MDAVPPEPLLSDGTVTLRPWETGDAADLVAALDGDEEIARWLDSIPQPYTDADAHAWLSQTRQAWIEGGACPFAVVDAATGRLLGGVGLRWNDRVNQVGEVGYWARADVRGQGVTTRALRLVTDLALPKARSGRPLLPVDTRNRP